MSKNNKAHYETIFFAWLLINGAAVGHIIGDIRTILTPGYRFDDAMGLDVTLSLAAITISTQRALYWYNKKQNTK
ncbi:MAG: hypothetical protein NC311_05975 [Muribaculaceae bacterium]|nr:hypothetical protein [Muribaculaceae bacterium]